MLDEKKEEYKNIDIEENNRIKRLDELSDEIKSQEGKVDEIKKQLAVLVEEEDLEEPNCESYLRRLKTKRNWQKKKQRF
ncbi:MAG: hypothetical protein MZV64_69745 [Ignavibacteriales bacterium]|nr:hypothetical protein [Ignavibacteriales bacterium]